MLMLCLLNGYELTYSYGSAKNVVCQPVSQLAKCHTKKSIYFCEIMQ